MSSQTIVLMVGIPASGKSTFIKRALEKEPSAICISRDEVRKNFIKDENLNTQKYFSREAEVFRIFTNKINNEIKKGTERIYVDATHISPASRKKILNRISNHENLNLEVVCLFCDIAIAQERNANRPSLTRVSRDALDQMYQNFTRPSLNELSRYGFKTVTIRLYKGG